MVLFTYMVLFTFYCEQVHTKANNPLCFVAICMNQATKLEMTQNILVGQFVVKRTAPKVCLKTSDKVLVPSLLFCIKVPSGALPNSFFF